MSPPDSDDVWLARVSRPSWRHAAVLFGVFVAAFALGALLARWTHPGSEVAGGAAGFVFFVAFLVGYKIWIAHAIAVFARGLFGGLVRALVRFVFTRRREAVTAEAARLTATLSDRDTLRGLVGRVRRRATVFRAAGIGCGALGGLAFGLLGADPGFAVTVLLFVGAGLLYGQILTALGHAGYLLLPEGLDV